MTAFVRYISFVKFRSLHFVRYISFVTFRSLHFVRYISFVTFRSLHFVRYISFDFVRYGWQRAIAAFFAPCPL